MKITREDGEDQVDLFDRIALAVLEMCQEDGKRRCLGILQKQDGTEEPTVMLEEEALKTFEFRVMTTVTPEGNVIIAKDEQVS